jgi:hypothetical protein
MQKEINISIHIIGFDRSCVVYVGGLRACVRDRLGLILKQHNKYWRGMFYTYGLHKSAQTGFPIHKPMKRKNKTVIFYNSILYYVSYFKRVIYN